MKIKTKTVANLKVGDRIETTNGMREVLAIEPHFSDALNIVVQCPASPSTPRAPLGEATISMLKKSKVHFFPAGGCGGCGQCKRCLASQDRIAT